MGTAKASPFMQRHTAERNPVSQSSVVLSETIGTVRVLILNRPEKLNAANLEMQRGLLNALKAASEEPELRALVLTGAGRAFSAGGDRSILQEIAAGESPSREELGRITVETMETMLRLEIPAIAAVNGLAIGYAAGLVSLCDIAVMGEGAFLSDPHTRYGIAAGPATQLIWPRLCSEAVARELLMSGRRVMAEEAARIGLCNRVCPDGDELKTALEIADEMAALPREGIAATKRAMNETLIEQVSQYAVNTG